jgi:hypothetical protein
MDGLSALGVAASVAQFIQFGSSLVSKSKEIYQSANGMQIQQVEAATAARRLVDLSESIKVSRQVERPRTEDGSAEVALEVICEGCISVSKELLSKLEKLKVEKCQKYRKFKSFRQALKSVCSKDAVDEIARRLEVVYPVQHFLRLANRSLLLTNGTPVGWWELEFEWEVPFDILNSVPEVLGHPVRH